MPNCECSTHRRGKAIKGHEGDTDLLAQYCAAFEKLDDLRDFGVSPALRVSTDAYGADHWQPIYSATPRSALETLYQGLGLSGQGSARFPLLYETLLLSYRWAEVELGNYRLLANEPAKDLSPLLKAMQADKFLFATLLPNSYVPFGKGPGLDYDSVCFDFRHRQKNGDCRIVKLDHESLLCDAGIRETEELAPNFRSLVMETIRRASSR